MRALMQNTLREDYAGTGVDLAQASYVAMTTLVQNSCSDSNDVIYQLMIPTLQTLEQTLDTAAMGLEKANHMQDLLCGLLQVILIKVGPMVEKPLAANIIQVIIRLFKQADKVTENGLIAFQGMVVGLGEAIDISEIGSYIKYALESKDTECASLACGIISDLSGSMAERMNEYLDDFVPCLHNILRDQSYERKIKLPALHALGDLCMYSGEQFHQKYLDGTLTILSMAARMSTQTQAHVDDVDTLEFLSELREEIIDQYIIILMAAGDTGRPAHFNPVLETIFDFLEATV